MKKYTFFLLSCTTCLDIAEDDLIDDDDLVFRAFKVWDNETWDKCCPHTDDGTSYDSFCGDDVSNTCPESSGFTTGWTLNGHTVDSWTLVNCNLCNTTMWSERWHDGGIWGFECTATAYRKNFNSYIDDDCSNEPDHTGNNNAPYEDFYCGAEGTSWPTCVVTSGNHTDDCQMNYLEKSVAMMCCNDNNHVCIPPWNDGTGPSCTHGAYQTRGYTTMERCMPCDGVDNADENDGSWDMLDDNHTGWDEWTNSINCEDIIDNSYSTTTSDTFATRFSCGGYLINTAGSLVTESCPEYP